MSRLSIAKAVVIAATAISLQANATAVNLVSNGSFETVDPNATSNAYKYYDSKTYSGINSSYKWGVFSTPTLTGWSSLYGNQIEIDINGVGGVDTAFGSNYLELDSHFGVTQNRKTTNESNVGIGQSISGLAIGQTYELSFWYRARTTLADDNIMNVYWLPSSVAGGLNQALSASSLMPLISSYIVKVVDYSAQDNNNLQWVKYVQTVVASSNTMTVGFGGAGDAKWVSPSFADVVSYNGNKVGAQLDNVSLFAVPAPATVGLLGLAFVGLMLRRRKA